MPSPIVGILPSLGVDIGQWFLQKALPFAAARILPIMDDPTGAAQRLGDLVIWQGTSGQKVLGMLGGISESQTRIEGAVERIETAQVAMSGTLGTVLNISLFHLGFSAFAAGFMLYRLKSLDHRLKALGQQAIDIKDHLDAMTQAGLGNGLTHLDRFEKKSKHADLDQAFRDCNLTRILYQRLVANELVGPKRLPVLNHCSRCYLLALMATVRCRVYLHDWEEIEPLLISERATMSLLARTTFELVLGKNPEAYLEPRLQEEGVTLDVMTEIYKQAHLAKALDGDQIRDAGQMFEQLRNRVYGASRGICFSDASRVRRQRMVNLRYLIATLEDINRVESVRVRIAAARTNGLDPDALEREFERSWLDQKEPALFASLWPSGN